MLESTTSTDAKRKDQNSAIKMLPGFITRVRVRCGKLNCHCARGDRHVAHYLVSYVGGVRFRKYVRRDQLPEVVAACEAHRVLQAQLRAGRAEYKQLLAQTRNLAKLIGSE
jgi:hypothetical protein